MTDLATRYGAPRRAPRTAVAVVAGVLAVAFLGWLGWVIAEQSAPEVTSETVSFDVVDEHTATTTFTVVRRTPEVEASCLLRAQSADHATVGESRVAVGPGGERVQTLTEQLRTEREATTVEVVGCVAEGQTRRR